MEKGISNIRQYFKYDYIDDDLFYIDSTKVVPQIIIDEVLDFETIVICKKGKIHLNVGGKAFDIVAGQILICPEYNPINDYMASPDVDLCIYGFSWHLLEDAPGLDKYIWPIVNTVEEHILFDINEDFRAMLKLYLSIVRRHVLKNINEMNEQTKNCKREILHLTFQSMVYEFINIIVSSIKPHPLEDNYTSRSTQIERTFYDILARGKGRIRSVTQVAEILNITPKYLSHTISNGSGHPPLFYIHQYMVRAIEHELTYSSKSIKEIAMDMGFPSISLFGKFVKEHLGVSPTEYRLKKK
jgi:AraC-like DNA-binding protein